MQDFRFIKYIISLMICISQNVRQNQDTQKCVCMDYLQGMFGGKKKTTKNSDTKELLGTNNIFIAD